MVIRFPGDRSKAEQVLRERRRLAAEGSERQRVEVEDAIASGDVVRMATLWLERQDGLASDACEESVRDMNRLTPELAHAANDEELPYGSMLRVRTLQASRWIYTQTPMIQLLVGAADEIERLRFHCEAKTRKARRSNAESPEGSSVGRTPSQPAQDHSAPTPASPAPAAQISASALVTIQEIEIETDIPYSTLTSRRLRLSEADRPRSVGKDRRQRDLYCRGDWAKIIETAKGGGPAGSPADA